MKSFLQTHEWADLKVTQGWQSKQVEGIFVLEKRLPFSKSFLYAPEVAWENISSKLQKILENSKKIFQKSKTIFFRLEILDEFDERIIQILKENGFQKSFEEIQPEWRQIIDVSTSEEEILSQMKSKGRYNIKVAQKHNVSVEKSDLSTALGVNEFYKIFCETAKRDNFEIRPQKYFQNLMQILGQAEIAELWLAYYNKKVIAAEIVIFYDDVATYLYGASKTEYRNLMAPYLLHWQVIKRAKEKGCKIYDLLAIEPADRLPTADYRSEKSVVVGGRFAVSHKYAGITRFKEQFGGRKVHLVGSWDLIYKPTWYKMFKIAEKYRRR